MSTTWITAFRIVEGDMTFTELAAGLGNTLNVMLAAPHLSDILSAGC
jgi:hypothetical protein